MLIKISSNQNSQFKEWKKLHQKKYRNIYDLFLVEGVKMIDEAINWKSSFEGVIFNKKLFDISGGEHLYKKVLEKKIPMYELDQALIKELSQTENTQGVIGVLKQPKNSINDFLNEEFPSLIILEEIQDPGNLGTIIRTADAAGFDAIILSKGCVDMYNDKVLRSTMGSIFHIPIIQDIALEVIIPLILEKEYQIIGTHLNAHTYYNEIKYMESKVLIIGNEGHGISKSTVDLCTDLVKIPMKGNSESLNAAIAAGILMYKMQGL